MTKVQRQALFSVLATVLMLAVPKELSYLKQCPHTGMSRVIDFMGPYQRKLNVFSRRFSVNTSL